MSEPALAGAVIADVREALALAAAVDAATSEAMTYELLDLFDHARRATLSRNDMPNKRGGQKLLANAIHRWTSSARGGRDPGKISDVKGELFAAMPTSPEFGKDYFQKLEEGGQITASSPMVIPFGAGARRSAVASGLRGNARFQQLLASKGLVQPGPGVSYLVERNPPSARAAARRTMIYGFMIRGRKQRPLMKLRANFDEVMPRHLEKMQKVIDQVASGVSGATLLKNAKANFGKRLDAQRQQSMQRLAKSEEKIARREAAIMARVIAKKNRTRGD